MSTLAPSHPFAGMRAELIEEAEWWDFCGLSLDNLAQHLKRTPGAMENAFRRAGRMDLYYRLRDRNPAPLDDDGPARFR
jgi:hypothetical protein